MAWPSADDIQYWSSVATIVGVLIAILALGFTSRQLFLSQRAGSVAALIALHEALRARWSDYIKAVSPEDRALSFGDLSNTVEIACAALADRMFFGESRKILDGYLLNTLKLIETHADAREELLSLLQEPKTFINIRRFLAKRRKIFRSLNQ
jgi:hypothetical protein